VEHLRAGVERELPKAIEALRQLVRIPTVAAQRQGIAETVGAVSALFRSAGGRVTVLEHAGANPVVVAEFDGRSPRTALTFASCRDTHRKLVSTMKYERRVSRCSLTILGAF